MKPYFRAFIKSLIVVIGLLFVSLIFEVVGVSIPPYEIMTIWCLFSIILLEEESKS